MEPVYCGLWQGPRPMPVVSRRAHLMQQHKINHSSCSLLNDRSYGHTAVAMDGTCDVDKVGVAGVECPSSVSSDISQVSCAGSWDSRESQWLYLECAVTAQRIPSSSTLFRRQHTGQAPDISASSARSQTSDRCLLY